jgi:hypothetical protein
LHYIYRGKRHKPVIISLMKKLHEVLRAQTKLNLKGTEKKSVSSRRRMGRAPVLTERLRQEMAAGTISNYDDVSEIIYGGNMQSRSTAYAVAHRLQQQMLNEMAGGDFAHTMRTEYNRQRYIVYRNMVVAWMLKIKGKGNIAVMIWEKTLSAARKYEFTTEAYLCAHMLCYEYAFRKKSKAHYNMSRVADTLLAAMDAEAKAARRYETIIMLVKDKWYINPGYADKVTEASQAISALARSNRTHDLWSMHFRTRIFLQYTLHNFRGLLGVCSGYARYLRGNPHLQQESRWSEIAHHQMNACIVTRRFSQGIRLAEENKKFMRPNNTNWFGYMENYFQLLMNAGEFDKARGLYDEVTTSHHRRNMSEHQRDVWKINIAYLHFAMNDAGAIKLFTPVRYFNALKNCNTDKEGLNFLIQVGQLMYLVVQGQSVYLDEFAENFKQYMKRHISRRRQYRSYYFSKLLLLLLAHHTDVAKAEAQGKKFHARLKKFEDRMPLDYEMTELIPFEHLWQILLRQMKREK